jgi:hypothetical protein
VVTLFYVMTIGPDGENFDLFVNADTHDEAGQLMVDYWAEQEVELLEDEPIRAVVVPAPGPKGVVEWGSLKQEECTVTHPDLSHLWENEAPAAS